MLDQNTDRMWYVIGAVIIGAALIFIVNSTFPQVFASVGETFKDKTDETTMVVDSITSNTNGQSGGEMTDGIKPLDPNAKNLIRQSDISIMYQATADMSDYQTTGIINMTVPSTYNTYAGIQLFPGDEPPLKTNTMYEFRYSYRKTDGELVSFGGHTDTPFSNNVTYVDGVRQMVKYVNDKSVYVGDNTERHDVVVQFTTPDTLEGGTGNRGLWIQPNRLSVVPVSVAISNMTLVEVK